LEAPVKAHLGDSRKARARPCNSRAELRVAPAADSRLSSCADLGADLGADPRAVHAADLGADLGADPEADLWRR
jgi:hypothetical protein